MPANTAGMITVMARMPGYMNVTKSTPGAICPTSRLNPAPNSPKNSSGVANDDTSRAGWWNSRRNSR